MLIKNNINQYLDKKLDYNFINDNKLNGDIAYYDSDDKVCQKVINIFEHTKKYNNDDYSKFCMYCISRFTSYNDALILYNNKFYIDFSKHEPYKGFDGIMYYKFKDMFWSEKIKIKDLFDKFIIYNYKEYTYDNDNLDVNFNPSLIRCEDYNYKKYFSDHNKHLIGPNLYMVINWLIKNDKLTIIDKNNYFMFFFNNQEKFHLERTKDNDVYFREEDFDYAIELIFKKLL